MDIEIIFAESGLNRENAGDARLPQARLEPSLSSFRRHFPEARFTLYTDCDIQADGVRVVRVDDPPFDKSHPRYGNRFNDYYGPYGMLQSTAGFVMCADSDLLIVNEDVRSIINITYAFKPHIAMPTNGRHIMWRDARSPLDGGPIRDHSKGCGMCHCTALIAMWPAIPDAKLLLKNYCECTERGAREKTGARGPLTFWQASWETGLAPVTLPREWCVTGSNLGDAEAAGRTVPIILHVGHETVRTHYKSLVEKWS